MKLTDYITLGRSGLRISPLSLGTMTFGNDWGWGADPAEAGRIFDAYAERGGNFIDTANFYTGGTAERLIGQLAAGKRERMVLATKYSLSTDFANPNAGGNHRLSMTRAVEASLKRLGTDYIDLLYLHAWDGLTPIEEIMRAFDDLVRAGKVLYAGISDTPAWQVARMQTLADLRGWTPLVALQVEYSLIARTAERELLPMADALGLGLLAWSPLGNGVLTGKYKRQDLDSAAIDGVKGSRKGIAIGVGALSERSLDIAAVVTEVAQSLGRSAAQVALAWLLQRPTTVMPILGARTLEQFEDNLGALDLAFAPGQLDRLDAASTISLGFPHDFAPVVAPVLMGSHPARRPLR